jgi:hypothetical protein
MIFTLLYILLAFAAGYSFGRYVMFDRAATAIFNMEQSAQPVKAVKPVPSAAAVARGKKAAATVKRRKAEKLAVDSVDWQRPGQPTETATGQQTVSEYPKLARSYPPIDEAYTRGV